MRDKHREHPMKPEDQERHDQHVHHARDCLKCFDYIKEKQVQGMTIRDGVLCKGCGEPLITTVEVEDLRETQRGKGHTTTTKYLTQAATPAYRVVTLGMSDGSKHQTPMCETCARDPNTDWQAIYTADTERLRQLGQDVSLMTGRTIIAVLAIEGS
jgi:hypothetical protein